MIWSHLCFCALLLVAFCRNTAIKPSQIEYFHVLSSMPVTSRVSFTPLVVTEFSVQQDWARTYAGTHTTTEQRRQRLLSFQHFLQNLDLGTKPKKTVQPFEPRAPKICHISTVNSTSSNCMEHACRLVIKKITGCMTVSRQLKNHNCWRMTDHQQLTT